jgi:hypothetical protein
MFALHGRPDPLLEPTRFFRLLRQVHDAELADVRKLGEDSYEIEPRPSDALLLPRPPRSEPATPVFLAPAPQPEPVLEAPAPESAPVSTVVEGGVRAGLRFRRGTKTSNATGVVPLVGVVRIEEDVPAEATERTGRKRSRRPDAEASPTGTGAPAKRPARSRSRKKPEKPAE